MTGSRPQSHDNGISLENSLELSITLVRFFQQQEELLQQQLQQQ